MAYKKSNTQERRLVLKIRLKYIIKKTNAVYMDVLLPFVSVSWQLRIGIS